MTLDQANKGEDLKIISIHDKVVRAQAFRFGISEGAQVKCHEKVPKGPVILKKNLQEIAVGRNLANKIEIELVNRGSR
jgi:ferrous iron transport protein A